MEPGPVTQSTTAMLRRTNSDLALVAAPVPGPGRGQGLEMDGAQSSCTTDDMASTPGIMVSAGWCYFPGTLWWRRTWRSDEFCLRRLESIKYQGLLSMILQQPWLPREAAGSLLPDCVSYADHTSAAAGVAVTAKALVSGGEPLLRLLCSWCRAEYVGHQLPCACLAGWWASCLCMRQQ